MSITDSSIDKEISNILAWLRDRYFRHNIRDVDSLFAFLQGYCLAARLDFPAYLSFLFDSVSEYFGVESRLLPLFAVRKFASGRKSEVATFYAWHDWLSAAKLSIVARCALTQEEMQLAEEKQRHFHQGNTAEIIPAPEVLLIAMHPCSHCLLLFIDGRGRRSHEICTSSVDRAMSAARDFVNDRLCWEETTIEVTCGTLGRLPLVEG